MQIQNPSSAQNLWITMCISFWQKCKLLSDKRFGHIAEILSGWAHHVKTMSYKDNPTCKPILPSLPKK
jgi:hypothetical protein